MFSFAWPWLFVLLPFPLLVVKWVKPAFVAPSALKIPFYQELTHSERTKSPAYNRARFVFLVAIWLLILSAAASPRWLGEPQPLVQSSRDLMLAVDISGSMETRDMQLSGQMINRLQGIKTVMDDFINRRRGDRLGLILFADNAYVQAPLTLDHKTLNRFLQEAQIGFAGKSTAIGEAIGLAVKRMQQSPEQSKVLLLLTDGANTAGAVTPMEAAAVAAENGLKIYTLGFGADEMIVQDFFSRRKVNPSQDLDEETLKKIAVMTGGKYFRARNLEQLVDIYLLLDQLEPSDANDQIVVPQRVLFHWPLAVAFLLSLLWASYAIWQRRVNAIINFKPSDVNNVR